MDRTKVTVESGACASVMPENISEGINIFENALSREGTEYDVADGAAIPNLGERHCEMYVEGVQQQLRINFQVADVHRPLLSLSKAADMGFRSYLDGEGGWLEDMESGEFIPIERRGDLYVLNIWVRGHLLPGGDIES